MFPIFALKKHYVVIGQFKHRELYLADAVRKHDTTIRTWTTNTKKAITFSNVEDAESIAMLVCDGDIEYKIGGIPAFPG